jgi:feruloyl esterase
MIGRALKSICIWGLALVAMPSGHAQGGDPKPGPKSGDRSAACAALAAIRIDRTSISSATAASADVKIGPFGPQPAHCVVEGEIDKHTGADGVEYGDRFQLRMPEQWNGRFLFEGGGGLDGTLSPAVGGPPGSAAGTALSRGYAVVTTDGGHQAKSPMDGSFGADPQSRADFQYRSTDLVAGVAKKIVTQYYGRAPGHSYFMGCSNGGREGMVAAERFPADFDGVVAGDPAFNLSRAAIAEAWFTVKLAEIAPKDPGGMPQLGRAFSESDLNLLSSAVLKACDPLDGLSDGLIDNPDACHFDPSVLLCEDAKSDSCLSSAQVDALHTVFGGPKNSKGDSLYSDWPYDGGLGAPGWRQWILGSAQMPSINFLIYPVFVNNVALEPGEAKLSSPFAFNFDTDPVRMEKTEQQITANSTNMASFRKHGGKIIFYTGMSDPVFSANDLIRYYRRLMNDNGGIEQGREFARLFRVAGMNHCAGGPALDRFDALTAIENWVEKGTAPDKMIATGASFPGRSRPLCAYPETPHYKGSGNTDEAASFVCRPPEGLK